MRIFKTRYRIVRDSYCGYEAQVRHWWFPVWLQLGGCNTFGTVEGARGYIRCFRQPVVEYVDA